MDDTFKNAQEQLDLITELVRDSRTRLRDNGFAFLVWGGAASVGTVLSYAAPRLGAERFIFPFWIVLAAACLLAVFLFYRKRASAKRGPKSFASRIYRTLWTGVVVGGFGLLLVAMVFRTSFGLDEGLAVLAVLLGLAYLVSAEITRYRVLTALGWLWMAGGAVCLIVPAGICPAVFGGLTFCLEFIPGLAMRAYERKQSV